jgi:hypothetical protein
MLLKKTVSIHENLLHGKNVSAFCEFPHMTPDRFKPKKPCFVTSAKATLPPPTLWEPKQQVFVEPRQFSNATANKQVVVETRRFSFPISPKKPVDIEAGRFSVTSPARRLFIGSRQAFRTRTFWMKDDGFAKTKAFQSRLENAATTVQKNGRRFLQRHCLKTLKIVKMEAEIRDIISEAATRIQTRARGMLQRVLLMKFCAARSIQAGLRGMWVRQNSKVTAMEQRLAEIEYRTQRELADIQAWKKKQMKLIRREMGADEKKKQQKDIDRIREIIVELREENKKIRSENEELREACERLVLVNQMIERNIDDVLFCCDCWKEHIKEIEATALHYEVFLKEFDRQKQVYMSAIEKRDEVLEFEQTVSEIARQSISQVMESIQQSKGCDRGLVEFVTNLAHECDL